MLLAGVRNWLGSARLPASPEPPASVCAEPDAPPAEPPRTWPRKRIDLAGELWGEGFTLPGGEAEGLRLAAPLGLSAASSLLLLGGGPGGMARAIAGRLGAWVSAFEADPDLAAHATALCGQAGLGRKARIALWDPAAPAFPPRASRHAIAFDLPCPNGPEPVLTALAGALRPGGQVILVDIVTGPAARPGDSALAAWLRAEGRSTAPPKGVAVTGALRRLGFDVRVEEDGSARHMALVVQGWHEMLGTLRRAALPPARAALLVEEAERWLLRVRLMRSGHLRRMRWHAIARGG